MLKKSSVMRVFFGVPIPKEKAQAFRDLIIHKDPKLTDRVRWVREGNHHITVRFLGNVEEPKIPLIVDAVEQSLQGLKPFVVTLRNITGFPGPRAHIVAINLQPSQELQRVFDAIDLAIAFGNFPEEKRAYLPHITMFRTAHNKTLQFEGISLENEPVEVKKVILYQSVPVERGNLYVPLNTFALS